MHYIYSNPIKKSYFSPSLSKLRQKLSQLIKSKSQHISFIFNNLPLIKGGVYVLNRRCGKPSCKCASTSYRHSSFYLYRSEQGKNNIIYIKDDEVSRVKLLTSNYIKFRQARAQLIKIEHEIMNVINQIEMERTIPFPREGRNGRPRAKQRKRNKKK